MLRSDAQANLDRILIAARAVFAERGLDAKLADVAARAGVGVGTVYRRFENKEALIATLFDTRLLAVVAEARAALEYDDPFDGLVHFLEVSTRMMAGDRALRELVRVGGRPPSPATSAHHGDELRTRITEMQTQVRELTAELVARAKAAGSLRPDVEGTDLGLISYTVQSAVDFGAGDDVWRRVLGLLVDGLRIDGERARLVPPALTDDELSVALDAKFTARG